MRRFVVLLLLAAPGAGQEGRDAFAVLQDHVAALGKPGSVETLSARSVLELDGRARKVGTRWRLSGECRRTYRGIYGVREELFGGEGAYTVDGLVQRWRPGQKSSREMYYLLRALARPFPLLGRARSRAAARGLRLLPSGPPGEEVLVGGADAHGVEAVYRIDRGTHLLRSVSFRLPGEQPFAVVSFDEHRRVGGVVLAHVVHATIVHLAEDAKTGKWTASRRNRFERFSSYEVNGKVAGRFAPPPAGTGGGRIFLRRRIPTGPEPYEAGAGDFDGDGAIDVAAACSGGLFVHFGGEEKRPVRVALGEGTHRGLAVEDLDLDGRPELITASHVAPADFLFLVTFGADRGHRVRRIYGAPRTAQAVVATDLDLDGIPDLVLPGLGSRSVAILFGDGRAGIRVRGLRPELDPQKQGRRGFGAAVGDLNGDGIRDLAVPDGKDLALLVGNAFGGFRLEHHVPAGPRPAVVALADLDGDGLAEPLVASLSAGAGAGGARVVGRTHRGARRPGGRFDAGVQVESLAAGDFNGDGNADLATASFGRGEVCVLEGDGRGGLGPPIAHASGRGTQHVVVTDLDGDGRDDVVATNRLDDSISLFVNRGSFPARERAAEPRARLCPPPTPAEFVLEGLSRRYAFAGEFRLPVELRDPSGITYLGGDDVTAQLMVVSDKRAALHRATLDRVGRRLLVGPPIPLRGLEAQPLDLEGLAFDRRTATLFLGCETDSSVVRATFFGHVLGRAASPVGVGDNDGLEALATRRLQDGTVVLYLLRERLGTTLKVPPVFVMSARDDPFRLAPRNRTKLPVAVPDQTGACVTGDALLVVSRFLRQVIEVPLAGDGFREEVKRASFGELTDRLLGLRSQKTPLYGMVEGICAGGDDLYLLVDNNGEPVGLEGRNRGREGRLLWFTRLGPPAEAK
ncbi:MAG: FG-GAP-like repeat-containing protein [Planctomycetota bacterium]